jgi:hypothetical protein
MFLQVYRYVGLGYVSMCLMSVSNSAAPSKRSPTSSCRVQRTPARPPGRPVTPVPHLPLLTGWPALADAKSCRRIMPQRLLSVRHREVAICKSRSDNIVSAVRRQGSPDSCCTGHANTQTPGSNLVGLCTPNGDDEGRKAHVRSFCRQAWLPESRPRQAALLYMDITWHSCIALDITCMSCNASGLTWSCCTA